MAKRRKGKGKHHKKDVNDITEKTKKERENKEKSKFRPTINILDHFWTPSNT